MVLAALALAVASLSHQRAQKERNVVASEMTRAASPVAKPHESATPDTPSDFVATLGAPRSTAQLVQELQRASSAAGIALASVQGQTRDTPPEQLGRLELSITLRGPYPAAKQVLKQAMERFPSLTVQRLRMRKGPSPSDTETSLLLTIWSAPPGTPAVPTMRASPPSQTSATPDAR